MCIVYVCRQVGVGVSVWTRAPEGQMRSDRGQHWSCTIALRLFIFWDRVSQWTWPYHFGQASWPGSSLGPAFSSLPYSELQTHITTPNTYMDAGDQEPHLQVCAASTLPLISAMIPPTVSQNKPFLSQNAPVRAGRQVTSTNLHCQLDFI